MTGRPRPKARARALNASVNEVGSSDSVGLSQTSDPSASQQSAKPKESSYLDDEEDDDDLFAHRRRLMRRVISRDVITPSSPPKVNLSLSPNEGESAEKKRKRNQEGEQDWVKSGVALLPEAEDEDNFAGATAFNASRPTGRAGSSGLSSPQRSGSFQPSPTPTSQASPDRAIGTISPSRVEGSRTISREDASDDEDDDAGATVDSSMLAAIQARYMTAQALSEFDKPTFEKDRSAEGPCQIVVECHLDPEREKEMCSEEKKEWKKKRVFEAPREEPLTGIYDTVGLKIGVSNPSSNLVMTLENGTRIWSCYATPESLKLADTKVTLLAYESRHYERMEEHKREVEAARFQGRLARKERSISPDLPAPLSEIFVDASASKVPPPFTIPLAAANSMGTQDPIELDSDSDDGHYRPAPRAANYSSDIEILDDLPRQAVFVPAPTVRATASETPVTSAGIEIQVRGQSGQLSGGVSSTTTYDAIIKWYANEMKIPIETAAKGRGKDRVPKKRLKIDFDGDLFDGPGKILDLDLEGGETLDIKYV